jgi:hypothetical protein
MSKVTILLETTTRDELKAIGRKSQTYDQLILQLIEEYRHGQQQQQQVAAAVMVSK